MYSAMKHELMTLGRFPSSVPKHISFY